MHKSAITSIIDYSYLAPCTDSHGSPGVRCYKTTNLSDLARCLPAPAWCTSDFEDSCVTSKIGDLTAIHDSKLCSNRTFWQNVGNDFYFGNASGLGLRCSGRMMHLYFPWYRFYNGEPQSFLQQKCDDKSDEVFDAEKPCHNRTYYLDVHRSEWCSSYPNLTICRDPSDWLENTFEQPLLDDPHNCQASCAVPGLNCIACTNEEYFHCPGSNTCIHPSLKCDGHPQCPGNEDENYQMCKQKYFENKLVKCFATYKCNSTMYPKVLTIATACNGITECLDGQDEESCNTDSGLSYILQVAIFFVLGLFFGLKIPHYVEFHQKNNG